MYASPCVFPTKKPWEGRARAFGRIAAPGGGGGDSGRETGFDRVGEGERGRRGEQAGVGDGEDEEVVCMCVCVCVCVCVCCSSIRHALSLSRARARALSLTHTQTHTHTALVFVISSHIGDTKYSGGGGNTPTRKVFLFYFIHKTIHRRERWILEIWRSVLKSPLPNDPKCVGNVLRLVSKAVSFENGPPKMLV